VGSRPIGRTNNNMKFTTGDPERDFFEQNPHWRYLESSKKLLKQVGKNTASKIRWAVFYAVDPDSPYYRYSIKKRVEVVNRELLHNVDIDISYDEDTLDVSLGEDLNYVLELYPGETMSEFKRDYYERKLSYEMLVRKERESTDLKIKGQVQLQLSKINKELKLAREELDRQTEEEKSKARGTQQPGVLFR